ncbi:MAG TPA: 2-oxoacid:acceptor oxidoreductase subunit alpha [Anaerolineae bacterium]|nr:2-oxoacid:acceptor oxidoreductase subunit alpha [Anaerolineae bacterium]
MVGKKETENLIKTNDGSMVFNDFCITISTVNGSGSATANNTILKAIFKMGIPAVGRNIFPSNIQGMPTWYSIRVNKNYYLGRVEKDNILIAMNQETIEDDLNNLVPGGVLIYDKNLSFPKKLSEIFTYSIPVGFLLEQAKAPTYLRVYLANMVYVGALAFLLEIDLAKIEEVLKQHFKGNKKAIDPNMHVINTAFAWSQEHLEKKDPYFLKPMQGTEGHIIANGNTAAALGALFGGLQFAAWYPITPATGIAESLNEYIPKLRKDPQTKKINCVVVQAEDELAAIGMSIGAGWAGLRSMTSTSGPGMCLMSEYIGLAYQSEVPVVIWDVQRVGPSTGLPTRSSQGDLSFSYFMSHGDTDCVILIPGSVNECFEFGWRALDIAEELQTPVILLSDLYLGMNNWMTRAFEYPSTPIKRGKVLWEKDLKSLLKESNGVWGRYVDLDGDGVPYRTVPGNLHPNAAYFTRGTGHDEYAQYSESPEVWKREHDRLKRKFITARKFIPEPILEKNNQAEIGIIAFGSTYYALVEACDILKKQSIKIDYLRIRALPFHDSVEEFFINHQKVYVVEANRDGQLAQLLMINYPKVAPKINIISRLNGISLSAEWIVRTVLEKENSDE